MDCVPTLSTTSWRNTKSSTCVGVNSLDIPSCDSTVELTLWSSTSPSTFDFQCWFQPAGLRPAVQLTGHLLQANQGQAVRLCLHYRA